MFRIATAPEAQLGEKARALLTGFPPAIGLPEPLTLLMASPGLLEVQAELIGYFRSHKTLSFPLLAAIRYLAARRFQAPACIDFNAKLLALAGMGEAELAALAQHPASAPLEPKEQALLAFVDKTLGSPGPASTQDLDALRALGWTDSDILDALAHGANMQIPALLMRALKD